jgi:hypothetical protein
LALSDLGITKKFSHDCQAIARLTEAQFAAHVQSCKTTVVVAAGLEKVKFPRRTAAKAHPRSARYPRVSRTFGKRTSERDRGRRGRRHRREDRRPDQKRAAIVANLQCEDSDRVRREIET